MFRAVRITLLFLILNLALFAAKLIAGLLFGSLAVLSDAFNSLVDIATSVMIYFAIKVGSQPADADHPFGHARAEPLAAFTVSVLTFVLAFEVIREALERIFSENQPTISALPVFVLLGVILVKSAMFFLARKFPENPALVALTADSKMDVVISLLALLGVGGINLGYPMLDVYAAIAIAFWIAWIGFTIARDNLAKLMGERPDGSTLRKIQKQLKKLKKRGKIISFHELRVQFIGSEIQVAVHIELPKSSKLEAAHAIEKEVQRKIKSVKKVAEVAVHVDPT
ncbi:cation diffusion facilitator family transporter [Patescibacteria group bacterium]|nr:cation diffusion facilitator family transporter [Patescibacteria group bacterium]